MFKWNFLACNLKEINKIEDIYYVHARSWKKEKKLRKTGMSIIHVFDFYKRIVYI